MYHIVVIDPSIIVVFQGLARLSERLSQVPHALRFCPAGAAAASSPPPSRTISISTSTATAVSALETAIILEQALRA